MSLRNFIRQPRYHFETPPGEAAGGGSEGGNAPPADAGSEEGASPPQPGNGAQPPAQSAWPSDWRDQLAGSDEAVRSRLERFQSPADVWRSYTNLERKLSSGEMHPAPPGEDASDDEVAAWREAVGLPAKPEDYYDAMGDLVIGDEDKERANSFLEVAHKHNVPPAAAAEFIKWNYAQQEAAEAARLEQDESLASETTELMREEWGPDYKHNVNRVHSLLDQAPAPTREGDPGVKERLLNARYNGDPVMSDPDVLRFLVGLSRDLNPTPTLLPGGGDNQLGTVEDRISEIDKMMRENRAAYNADQKVQQEYRDLLEHRARLRERSPRR